MKFHLISKYIIFTFLTSLTLSSCSDSNEEDSFNIATEEKVNLMFSVNALGTSVSVPTNERIEKLRSLRIIIIDSEGLLEVNELADLKAAEYNASTFSYVFTKELNGRDKKLFLIGNEKSIGKVGLSENDGLPENLPLGNLSRLLDYFQPATSINGVASGEIFEKVLNRIYFENNYSEVTDEYTGEKTLVSDENSIFLPYSAYYKLDRSDMGFARLNNPIYIVPVATKIDFNFVSYRSHDTQIKDIKVCSLNSNNFLNAQLSEEETVKTLSGKTVWWIDWLEECSRNSHSAADLEDFNNKWGWIEDYYIPLEEPMIQKGLYSEAENEEDWIISRMVDKNNPDRSHIGPFYLPESKNPDYSLTFEVYDMTSREDITLEGYELDTVKTLFRGTHVIINVELYERAMDIYAEIVPWTQKVFIGYVQQEDDDD